jgi:antitoxin (DNA-binding transcriptional repressor) of toxin-antitoxin stability system
MEKASVSGLKNSLSAYLRKVRAGHTVLVMDRDVPIARIERIESTDRSSARLAKLHSDGRVRPPSRRLPLKALRNAQPPAGGTARGLLDALLAERREHR